jgi:PAS domain S-box-containing protein
VASSVNRVRSSLLNRGLNPISGVFIVIAVVFASAIAEGAAAASWPHFILVRAIAAGFVAACCGLLVAALASRARKLERRNRELCEARTILSDAIESVSEPFVIWDRDDRFVMCNEAARAAFGENADVLAAGQRFEDVLRQAARRGVYGEVADHGEEWLAERVAVHRQPSGTVEQRLADGRTMLVVEQRMKNGGSAGLRVDVTRLKQAEARLRDTMEHLTRIQRIAGVGSLEVDITEGREKITWSAQTCVLFGIDPALVERTPEFLLQFIHPDDRQKARDASDQAHHSGIAAPALEYRIIRPDGDERVVYRENAIQYDERGSPIRRIVTYKDITAFKNAEARLREAMGNLERAQQLAHVGGHIWDLRTGTLTWSAETYRIFGVDPDAFVPTPESIIKLVIPEDRPRLQVRRKAIMRGKCPPATEFSVRRPDGEVRRIYSEAEIVFDDTGKPVRWISVHQDITERCRIESSLREAKDAAEAANLAKSQFLANMSHELRTPLNAIVGFSQALELGISGPLLPKQQGYVRLIRQSGDHLHSVINDILDLAKVDAGKFELHEEVGVDPLQILEACGALVAARAKEGGLALSAETGPDLPLVVVDSTRFKQILLNLVSNAVKFTEPGGEVVLAARETNEGGIAFEVRDTGPGMTADEIKIALEPFGQVDARLARRHEGTGLGLPLARRLAELHNGSLRINSTKGSGTTVTVTLPAERVARDLSPAVSTVAAD